MEIITNKSNFVVIQDKNFKTCLSYNVVIAKINIKTNKITLDSKYWDYSRTTRKHRNEFLGMDAKQISKMIANKEIKLADLNKQGVAKC